MQVYFGKTCWNLFFRLADFPGNFYTAYNTLLTFGGFPRLFFACFDFSLILKGFSIRKVRPAWADFIFYSLSDSSGKDFRKRLKQLQRQKRWKRPKCGRKEKEEIGGENCKGRIGRTALGGKREKGPLKAASGGAVSLKCV